MRVSKTIGIYFSKCFGILVFSKRVIWWNSVLAIGTVSAHWVYTKNSTPYFFYAMRQESISFFNTAAISNTYI